YTNEWVIEVKGGEETAKEVAREHHLVYIDKVMDDFYLVKHRRLSKRSIKSTYKFNRELSTDSHITWFQQQVAKVRVKRDTNRVLLTDPKWPRMWYMNQENGNGMNIMVAWKRGYTGRNVVVSILDDGIEKDHPDLKKNYDPEASYDVNDHDPDPQPRYDNTNENKHGTRCAGEVAAQFNNSLCGIGVAYNARIGGVRMLDGDVTDAVEAKSLSWKSDYVQIYSASWGPDDDGKTVDGPGPITAKAFEDGILKGRNGLGSIFVWASGNGGQLGDDCNCDGYTNLIYTLSISGVSENGNVPWYSEACSSALASAYSSGNSSERQIVTTDLNKQCTENHTGTSASAPLAVGMIALTMEANTQLTWRDVQHIVVLGAKRSNLVDADFKLNGANKYVSHRFGFGLMDVGRMVELAENWTRVPAQRKCVVPRTISQKGLSVNSKLNISLTHNGCLDTEDEINYLEHVQVIISLASQKRGELEIFLISPSGTKSTLLGKRPNDFSTDGFLNWTFMTTHCWGETAAGTWKLEIRNSASLVSPSRLLRWTLVLYGTKKEPYSAPLQHLNPQRPPLSSVSSSSASSLSSSSIYKHSLFPYHYSHSHQHSLHHLPHRHHQHHQQQHNNIQKIDFMPYSSLGWSLSHFVGHFVLTLINTLKNLNNINISMFFS
ncbi:hypothetical protein HELRODRAFT_82350, partial [Helobdella robusta]|uniref:P/Homo B domain-containing protein n=1 Tax=Helobdella robusta TaxID=6412 RepID=T1G4R0_HELRO